MVAGLTDGQDGGGGGGLAGRGQHGADAAFQRGDLFLHGRDGGVAQAGIKVAGGVKVKEIGHHLGVLVFKGSALVDGQDPGLAVFRLPARLDAIRVDMAHADGLLIFFIRPWAPPWGPPWALPQGGRPAPRRRRPPCGPGRRGSAGPTGPRDCP